MRRAHFFLGDMGQDVFRIYKIASCQSCDILLIL